MSWMKKRSARGCSVNVVAAAASYGDQHLALHELGDEAEHVAFYGAVLGRELGAQLGDYVGEAALPVELVPDGLARVAQREQFVLHVADAGDQWHDDDLALDLAGDDVVGRFVGVRELCL